ncbi:TIR-only protein-like [Zingiber officinale]|uniref:TIR-only protein-like n=1 Tax=Zingiber officinale TaxID=94328 RepID=UPI001C4C7CA5|nr:TIR-only protein-like [Zingiber officinale]
MSVSAMRRVVVPRRASISRVLSNYQGMAAPTTRKAAASTVDVFLSHRGADTKSTVAGLLYDRLAQMGVRPFLDSRSMEPGDKIYERVDAGIRQSRVGVAIFSPRYCDSVSCLHELAMMVEAGKKLIPIFYDVKPAELAIGAAVSSAAESPEDLARYARAIREAKLTVGLTFDSKKGDWSDLVSRTSNVVLKCLKQAKVFIVIKLFAFYEDSGLQIGVALEF